MKCEKELALLREAIRKGRKNKKITQEELAEKLEVSPTHVKHIESGHRKPSIEILFEITKILNISLDGVVFSKNESARTDTRKAYWKRCAKRSRPASDNRHLAMCIAKEPQISAPFLYRAYFFFGGVVAIRDERELQISFIRRKNCFTQCLGSIAMSYVEPFAFFLVPLHYHISVAS